MRRRIRTKRPAVGHFLRHAQRAAAHALLLLNCLGHGIGRGHATFARAPASPEKHGCAKHQNPDQEWHHRRQRKPTAAAKQRNPDCSAHEQRQRRAGNTRVTRHT
jgi:hypothetical protein